jgi:hypothetical protein
MFQMLTNLEHGQRVGLQCRCTRQGRLFTTLTHVSSRYTVVYTVAETNIGCYSSSSLHERVALSRLFYNLAVARKRREAVTVVVTRVWTLNLRRSSRVPLHGCTSCWGSNCQIMIRPRIGYLVGAIQHQMTQILTARYIMLTEKMHFWVKKSGGVHVHVDPHTNKKWGGQDPGTPTGSPPLLRTLKQLTAIQ